MIARAGWSAHLAGISRERHVLIAGPTASGKTALAIELAQRQGGVIVNADAIQVFANWRVVTARPSVEEEAAAPHRLFGHIAGDQPYSTGAWLREVAPLLAGPERLIITGGTGLYFTALTEGLADIPPVPEAIRETANARIAAEGLAPLLAELDAESRARIDPANPARVTRAWSVLQATGRGIAAWQDETPPPLLPLDQTAPMVVSAPKEWLTPRIERRFDLMLEGGALEEARDNLPLWSPDLPSAKAIGAPELIAHLRGEMTLDEAREAATVATRRFAKRQRTWFRARMRHWQHLSADA
ncbi:tRNA (adenosine(37)-N6)-dimethylallyltransferase MiaA [Maritimibacter alkaliphilus]|uniref:tRNA (adenosine(37)-N6)-dimethylallyltransferase MiaA n=1 Tax=Maritimibacter alkaliphilus TaxID=404236 RepID=UPI001C95595B|nr:tRNA (adenosine(37)-N6)-dimethylallyltransferase MiaA [Maritimibacter alkaliphilus]MBY6089470.1 tRNA (adenosine(37)-N6)-dimethylallyltransferase MiaA [Maritimibacter alkaliphilus]